MILTVVLSKMENFTNLCKSLANWVIMTFRHDVTWKHVCRQRYSLNRSLLLVGGYMEGLDGKWIQVDDTKCPEKDTSPATLGLTNMAGKNLKTEV